MEKYRGIIDFLPSAGCRSFRMSIAFIYPVGRKFEKLKDVIQAVDPSILNLLKSNDLKEASISVYIGDPEEELEKFLEEISKELTLQDLDCAGFLVLSRSARLGTNDSLPQTQEEWDAKIPALQPTAGVENLFEHLRKYYLQLNSTKDTDQ